MIVRVAAEPRSGPRRRAAARSRRAAGGAAGRDLGEGQIDLDQQLLSLFKLGAGLGDGFGMRLAAEQFDQRAGGCFRPLPVFVHRLLCHLLLGAAEMRELEQHAVQFLAHLAGGLRQLQAGLMLDLHRIATEQIEDYAEDNPGNGRGHGHAEIANDLSGIGAVGILDQGHRQAGQRVDEPHVVKVVAGLIAAQPQRLEQPDAERVADHQQDRDQRDHDGVDVQRLGADDVGDPDHREGDEDGGAGGVGAARARLFHCYIPISGDRVTGLFALLSLAHSSQKLPSCSASTFCVGRRTIQNSTVAPARSVASRLRALAANASSESPLT